MVIYVNGSVTRDQSGWTLTDKKGTKNIQEDNGNLHHSSGEKKQKQSHL